MAIPLSDGVQLVGDLSVGDLQDGDLQDGDLQDGGPGFDDPVPSYF
tara:strand:- start:511 stop:648 length:138 start_codon:yes stop_codon:yes gene_type:complete